MEEVALEAGLTKGAVYSTFESKASLMLELLDQRIQQHTRSMERAISALDEGDPSADGSWIRSVHDTDKRWSALNIEFWAHAARDPELREEFARRHCRQRDQITRLLGDAMTSAVARPVVPTSSVARVLMALIKGFALEVMLDVESDTQELLEASLLKIARALLE